MRRPTLPSVRVLAPSMATGPLQPQIPLPGSQGSGSGRRRRLVALERLAGLAAAPRKRATYGGQLGLVLLREPPTPGARGDRPRQGQRPAREGCLGIPTRCRLQLAGSCRNVFRTSRVPLGVNAKRLEVVRANPPRAGRGRPGALLRRGQQRAGTSVAKRAPITRSRGRARRAPPTPADTRPVAVDSEADDRRPSTPSDVPAVLSAGRSGRERP